MQDNEHHWARDHWTAFLLAVQFLTRVPVPEVDFSKEGMARSTGYHPAVGILVGLAGGIVYLLAAAVFPQILAVLLACAATILITGAFHEDGLADVFDGIGGGATVERALEIMRDSRIGTYGALAMGLTLAMKVAALAALPHWAVLPALALGHGLSRYSAVAVIRTGRYVREAGKVKPVAHGIAAEDFAIASGTGAAAVLALFIAFGLGGGATAIIGLAVGHFAARLVFERRIGGYTGDCLGSVQQISELIFYLALVSSLS